MTIVMILTTAQAATVAPWLSVRQTEDGDVELHSRRRAIMASFNRSTSVALTIQLCYPVGLIPIPGTFPMPHVRFRAYQGILTVITAGLVLACQSAPPITEGYPHQQSLRGKSKEQVLACAGTPLREWQNGDFTLLRYFREAPLLEESMATSKSSRPTMHHGCWATVSLQNDRVDQVRYRFVPSSIDSSHDCEEIFARCQE